MKYGLYWIKDELISFTIVSWGLWESFYLQSRQIAFHVGFTTNMPWEQHDFVVLYSICK